MGVVLQACCRMPWNETAPMNERVKFIARYLHHDDPFATLCAASGISRKTGYKWASATRPVESPRSLIAHGRRGRIRMPLPERLSN
jgi:hypothetical protein